MAKIIKVLSALLVFLLAAGAFVLSYSALYAIAKEYGIPAHLAWIWPLLVDFALVVFSLSVVRANIQGESTRWPWAMVGLFTITTIAFNLIHSQSEIIARFVAIVPPVALFLSFETLMAMLRSGVKPAGIERPTVTPDPVVHQPKPTEAAPPDEPHLEPVKGPANPVRGHAPEPVGLAQDVAERRERVLSLLGEGMTQAGIAERLGVGLSTVKRDIRELNGRVKAL